MAGQIIGCVGYDGIEFYCHKNCGCAPYNSQDCKDILEDGYAFETFIYSNEDTEHLEYGSWSDNDME